MKLDDLTIFLKAVDQTKKAVSSASKNLLSLQGVSKVLRKSFAAVAFAAGGMFIKAVSRGSELTDGLITMRKQLDLTFQEAQSLFNSVRDVNPGTNIDNLNEALLSLKERFADAASGAGPLHGLMEDFEGFELDLGVDNARDQLADFLEQVSKLPDANAKIFALKEVVGDQDAHAFFNIINDTETLLGLLEDLRGDVLDVEDVLNNFQVEGIETAKQSSGDLSAAWDDFAVKAYAFVAPSIGVINNGLAWMAGKASLALDGISKLQTAVLKLTGQYVDPIGVELTDSAEQRLNELGLQADATAQMIRDAINGVTSDGRREKPERKKRTRRPEDTPVINKWGEFKNIDEFEAHMKKIRDLELDVLETRGAIGPEDLKILQGIDAANDPNRIDDTFNFNGFTLNFPEENNSLKKTEEDAAKAEQSIQSLQDTMGAMGQVMQEFSRVSGKENSKSFRSFQKLQAALALVSTWAGAANVLADTRLSYYEKIPAFLTIVGAGLKAVNTIKSLNENSTSASGGGVGSASATSGPQGASFQNTNTQQGPQRQITVNIQGNAPISTDQLEDLIRELNDNDTGLQIDSNRIAA